MISKYVVVYSTGEYDDYRHCIEPMCYKGTKEELYEEFKRSYESVTYKWRILNIMRSVRLIDNQYRTGHQNYEIKIGSRYFDVMDFTEKNGS